MARFAPVPIETTFQSVRKSNNPVAEASRQPVGPTPELTPEPSPRSSPSPTPPEPRERLPRHFAPQLIETSRRARRVGDAGPATRPTDKTDITPYTKHIYTSKNKPRPRSWRKRRGTDNGEDDDDDEIQLRMPPTRRETEEEGVTDYLLELASKEAERLMQEAALAAFPNSGIRTGGAAHFYFSEDSSSDKTPESAAPSRPRAQTHVRRKSSDQDVNWWQQHMRDHAQQLARGRGEDLAEKDEDVLMRSDSDLDKMDIYAPPDPLWTTTKRIAAEDRRDSMEKDGHIRGRRSGSYARVDSKTRHHDMPDAPPIEKERAAELTHSPAPKGSTDGRTRSQASPFGRPFGNFGLKTVEPTVQRMRQLASPPMLGKDLTFRTCPSPKLTKLDTDHPFAQRAVEDKHRDTSGQGGLWRGYCYRNDSDDCYLAPSSGGRPLMIHTPQIPGTPGEPDGYFVSQEPASILPTSGSTGAAGGAHLAVPGLWGGAKTQAQPTGLHMLHGLDERLRKEKAASERDEKIAQEFSDEFVTQVYNYLSLGYPSMAMGFDEELSKISRMGLDELRRNDENKATVKGHMLEMTLEDIPEDDRCPRWRALRIYVTEWAKQLPDLDSLDLVAWGVRERRGSWAI